MIQIKTNIIQSKSMRNKQRGATLFTALVFLALMTIVSVSAAKISMLDVLVSGNNQQIMELYQETAREIDDHTDPSKLLTLVLNTSAYEKAAVEWSHDYPVTTAKPNVEETITNRALVYPCGAIDGLATSQGVNNKCHLFDFEVRTRKNHTSARERHVRGGGKEYPSISRNNFNN